VSSEFIAELERRAIAVQNEIAFLEELRWRSTIEEQRLDLLKAKLIRINGAIEREMDQLPLIEEEA
jgi:hypothetical protein